MAVSPLYPQLIKFWKSNPADNHIYAEILRILRSLRGVAMTACETSFEDQHSQAEIEHLNVNLFKYYMPILDKWHKVLAHGATLPQGDRGVMRDDMPKEDQLALKRYRKRTQDMPGYSEDLHPECDHEFWHQVGQTRYSKIELHAIPRLPSNSPDYAYSLLSFAFYQLLQKYPNAKLFFFHCSSCKQAFCCTKRAAKYCSSACRTNSQKRARRIPGIDGIISEADYQASRRDLRGRTPVQKAQPGMA